MPIEALQSARSACAAAHQVRISLEDAVELRIACDASWPLPKVDQLRRFDATQTAVPLDSAPERVPERKHAVAPSAHR